MREQVLGVEAYIATAEDTVITKLEWSRQSGSERQLEDVAGILSVRRETLDREYLERWVTELGLQEQWQKASTLL